MSHRQSVGNSPVRRVNRAAARVFAAGRPSEAGSVPDHDIAGTEPTAAGEHAVEDLQEAVTHAADRLNRPPAPVVQPPAAMPLPDLQDLPRLVGLAVLSRLAYSGMEASMEADRRLQGLPAFDSMTDEEQAEAVSQAVAAGLTILAILYLVDQFVDWLKRRFPPDA